MSKDMTTAAEALAAILGQENEALRGLDLRTAGALVAAKQAALEALSGAPSTTATPLLTALAQRLRSLAAENHALLERAMGVQARIIQIVASAYRPPAGTLRYGRDGEQAAPALSGVALSTKA